MVSAEGNVINIFLIKDVFHPLIPPVIDKDDFKTHPGRATDRSVCRQREAAALLLLSLISGYFFHM